MPTQQAADEILSFAVNQGLEFTMSLEQNAINDCTEDHIAVDGNVGPATEKAADAVDQTRLAIAVLVRASFRYGEICGRNPADAKFGLGWIRRAEDAART